MDNKSAHEYQNEILEKGFAVMNNLFSEQEIACILGEIAQVDTSKDTFRKTSDLFAIRQFLKEVPNVQHLIFNERLKTVIEHVFGKDYFVVKSIYFDKPEASNWYVAYHQDLTISVDKKMLLPGFGPWTVKHNQYAVQPPLPILENMFTVRIHLDDTNVENGALKVIEQSHGKGIYRPETIDWNTEKETVCEVPKGGIMIMKPLLLHASNRTTNHQKRRVIHVEFANTELPEDIKWSERINFPI